MKTAILRSNFIIGLLAVFFLFGSVGFAVAGSSGKSMTNGKAVSIIGYFSDNGMQFTDDNGNTYKIDENNTAESMLPRRDKARQKRVWLEGAVTEEGGQKVLTITDYSFLSGP